MPLKPKPSSQKQTFSKLVGVKWQVLAFSTELLILLVGPKTFTVKVFGKVPCNTPANLKPGKSNIEHLHDAKIT